MRGLLLSASFTIMWGPVWADSAALLLGVADYKNLDPVAGATETPLNWRELGRQGFTVSRIANGSGARMQDISALFAVDATKSDDLVVALAGRFVTDGKRTWLLGRDARPPNLFNLGQRAVSIESILTVLSENEGKTLLIIGYDAESDDAFDQFSREGLGDFDIPIGVTVVSGPIEATNTLVADSLLVPNVDIMAAVRSDVNLKAEGFVPRSLVLNDGAAISVDTAADDRAFQSAKSEDTEASYLRYLLNFPKGRNSEAAANLLENIRSEPFRNERLAEEALGLLHDERQDIQRDLALLGYDTRGIDGIFGPGTRASIAAWQVKNGNAQTAYLTSDQIGQLDAQAARRAQRLEEEAAKKAAELDRRDRAFWAETGDVGNAAGYRTYLDRFPDGRFAERARNQLARIETQSRSAAVAEDRAAWDIANTTNTVNSYNAYLSAFPRGAFVDAAKSRIAQARRSDENAAAAEVALQIENGLGLNPISKTLIEGKLDQLGLNPGAVDGRFDQDTRRAVRRYQSVRGLEETGYINQATAARLLADTFSSIRGGN